LTGQRCVAEKPLCLNLAGNITKTVEPISRRKLSFNGSHWREVFSQEQVA
jgi:hypothetical protein